MKAADNELRDLLTGTGTGTALTSLNGIGLSGAARLLIEASDISRFPSKVHFASWNRPDRRVAWGPGPPPPDPRRQPADQPRALHIMAVVQLRHRASERRAYYEPQGRRRKTPRERMRSLKRQPCGVACHQKVPGTAARKAGRENT